MSFFWWLRGVKKNLGCKHCRWYVYNGGDLKRYEFERHQCEYPDNMRRRFGEAWLDTGGGVGGLVHDRLPSDLNNGNRCGWFEELKIDGVLG